MKPTKLLLLALAGLVMTGCIVREGGGYYGRGGGYGVSLAALGTAL